MEVQKIGPRSAILAEARELAAQTGGFLYGEQENGGTNTFYVSPVPFDLLNQAVEQGPGRPHLQPVENSMAKAESLTWAVLLGPLAGIGAALLTTARDLTHKGDDHEQHNDHD